MEQGELQAGRKDLNEADRKQRRSRVAEKDGRWQAMPLRDPVCRVVDATVQERWEVGKWRKSAVVQVEKSRSRVGSIDDRERATVRWGGRPGRKGGVGAVCLERCAVSGQGIWGACSSAVRLVWLGLS